MLILRIEYTSAQMIGYCLFGTVCALLGLAWMISARREEKKRDMDLSPDCEVTDPAQSCSDPELIEFRKDCAAFFAAEGIRENSAVQNDTTQLYKNVLDRQKRRLDRLGITMGLRSVRKQYIGAPVQRESRFDGKYEITGIDEQIEARRKFTKNGKTLFLRTSDQVAHYTMLDAVRVGGADTVLCPGCGNATTRENLIDGCDYCGTRFTVEDLGRKVSAFSFRDKYDIARVRFGALRSRIRTRFLESTFLLFYFLFLLCFLLVLTDEAGVGETANPLFWTFSLMSVSGVFALLLHMPAAVVYMLVIFPALSISASFKYNSRKKLRALQAEEAAEAAFAEKVRAADPLFSLADFHTNVQNKLSSVIYAANAGEINTFACTDLSPLLAGYANVFDYDIDRLCFKEFREEDGLRRIDLTAELRLFSQKGRKVRNRREKIRLQLIRSAACNTEAVCAPSVMRCRKCGSSLSFSEGLICPYCDTRTDLKQYDWVIAAYEK